MGEIVGPNGFVVNFDIGHMAGTHMYASRKGECDWFMEHTVAKTKALTGVVRVEGKRRVITTIFAGDFSVPPANFWTTIRNEKDLAQFLALVTTYIPPKAASRKRG